MLGSLLKSTLRAARRRWSDTVINVTGLAVGLAASFLILLWVQDERRFDTSYPDVERVFRVMRTSSYGPGQVFTWPAITAKLDDVLDEEYPEVELASLMTWEESLPFRRDASAFRERGYHVGRDFLRILRHEMLAGDPATALNEPGSVVLSLSMARKYFPEAFRGTDDASGAASAMGRRLTYDNRLDVAVSGVIADPVAQATFRPDFLLPMEEFIQRNDWVDDWGNNGLRMLVRLAPEADPEAVSGKIRTIIQDHTESDGNVLFLQRYTDIYLRSGYENGVLVGGRIGYVRVFEIVAIFVLLIAAINFMNLATARSSRRAMEIGIRKAFGSGRSRLAAQFVGESVATALAALLVAAGAVLVLLDGFNELTGKQIELGLVHLGTWIEFVGIAVATGLVAALYPAAFLSSFPVIGVLRARSTGGGGGLRRGLVVFQFVLSVTLIVGAGTVHRQIEFIRNKNLGLDRKDVFYSRLEGPMLERFEAFRTRLLADPSIESVTQSSSNPLEIGSSTSGGVRWDGRIPDDRTLFYVLSTGYDFLRTMRMELAEGRDFSPGFGSDSVNILVNETAAGAMGMDRPVGQTVTVWGRTGQIIGVVKDFHVASLYDPIEPMVMRLSPSDTWLAFVRPATGQTSQALAAFERVFREFNPLHPFETTFVDESFERAYRNEVVVGRLSAWFTAMAILVACLGLFGLASFSAERRAREIGIRKVLGATIPHLVGLLSREFVALVGGAFLLAAPISLLLMDRWLDRFAFRAEIGWALFAMALGGVLLVTVATVSYQSIRAARVDPVRSIRSE